MSHILVSELGDYKNHESLQGVWEACGGPVYLVLDEEGNNVADGKIRHLTRRWWIYVDDTDGYTVMDEPSVEDLIIVPEESD